MNLELKWGINMKRIFLCLISLALVMAICAGCAAGSGSYDSAPSAASAAPDYDAGYYGDYHMERESEESTRLPFLTPSNSEGSKIVYTVSMQLQTTSFEEGTRNLLNVASEMGGFVQSTYIKGRSLYAVDTMRLAEYTLRIPSDNLAGFLVVMEDSYNLLELRQNSQDINAVYDDTNARLDSLRRQEEQLLSMLAETQDIDEKLMLEDELANIRAEMGRLTSSVKGMDNSVVYSTVTIQLFEVAEEEAPEAVPLTFSDRVSQTANKSWGGFLAFCQFVILFIIAALPVILVLVVVGLIVFLVLFFKKKINKRKLSKQRENASAANSMDLSENEPDSPNDGRPQ